jgi:uncharacterized membrane protein
MKISRESLLSKTFHTGITLKGIDGLLEIAGGVLLWFLKPRELSEIARFIFQHELSRDPDDWIAVHVLHATEKLANADPAFASLFLLSHGVTKVALVTCLWMNKLWAYPLTIVVFAAFSAYQMYRYTHTHSIWLIVLTLFDLVLIYLTWAEYKVQERKLQAKKLS